MRILLAEDDELVGDGVQSALESFGYRVDWLTDGRDALHSLTAESFDLVILDLGLPRMDGLDVLKKARQADVDIPVLILTARDQIRDRVAGLDLGADDYLLKPFDIDELEARIRALTRRYSGRATASLQVGELAIDPKSRTASNQGQPVSLSRREFDLLLDLASHRGKVRSRRVLEELLYGWQDEVESNALEVHIHNLRKKLGSSLVKTVRGVGYMIE